MATVELLQGIRILAFTMNMASAFCSRILADMGAEVIKVERGPLGDPARVLGLFPVDGSNSVFINCNVRNKSLCIDLRNPEGVSLIKQLVPQADAVLSGFTPGQGETYGVDYESLRSVKSDIVYCSLTGYGQYGPYRDRVATGAIISAIGGMFLSTGDDKNPPIPNQDNADSNAAINAAVAVLAALICHEKTGIGQHVDTSMLDSLIFNSLFFTLVTSEGKDDIQSDRHGKQPVVPSGAFYCKGEYIQLFIAMSGELSMWGRFCKAIGRPDMITDPRFDTPEHRAENSDETNRIVQDWFDKQPSAKQAVAYLQEYRVPCGEINSQKQILTDPNTKERELVRSVYHPEIDREAPVMFTPYKFSETPILTKHEEGTPLLGQHNEDILKEYLSYTDEQIQDLYKKKVIYQDARVPQLKSKGSI